MSDAASSALGADFGRYLASVAERDVDLLLMEEFHISDEFVSWFCNELGLDGVSPAGAWHSVSDSDGETDLLLRVIKDGRRIGILIENKINAPQQDAQGERYHLRAIKSREAGKFDEYRVVICAPDRYLSALPPDCVYPHRCSYEQIASWFGAQEGRRASWRHQIMLEAIEQARRGYTMIVDADKTAFHFAYWEYLRRQHPRIHMERPKSRGSKSDWIILKEHDFPKGVNLHHKFDQQRMEIGFQRHRIEEIRAIKSEWPEDIIVVQKGKTASLAINVPFIDTSKDFVSQLPAVEQALAAAYRLMPYAGLFKNVV
jgi:hypothetical protein